MSDITAQYQIEAVTETAQGPVLRLLSETGARIDVPGRYLEQVQEAGPDTRLAFLTHGILPEERLSIVLLQAGKLVEQLDLTAPFIGTPPRIEAESCAAGLRFRFPADRLWRLDLWATPRWRMPRIWGWITYAPLWRGRMQLTREEV